MPQKKKSVERAEATVEVPVIETQEPASVPAEEIIPEAEPAPSSLPVQAEPVVVNLAAQEEKAPVFPQTSAPGQNPFIASYQADVARKKRHMWALVIIVVLIIAAGAGYMYWRSSQLQGQIGDTLTDTSVATIIARIERLAAVPSGEQPTVALIRNADLASAQQDFYRGASSGDILVVYSDRALIYDPRADKIINMSLIERSAPPAASVTPEPSLSPDASPTPKQQPLSVEVRNGTSTTGLAKATCGTIEEADPLFSSCKTGDASKKYMTNVIVDQSKGKNPELISALEKLLGVTAVTSVPKGERESTADVLVIMGK